MKYRIASNSHVSTYFRNTSVLTSSVGSSEQKKEGTWMNKMTGFMPKAVNLALTVSVMVGVSAFAANTAKDASSVGTAVAAASSNNVNLNDKKISKAEKVIDQKKAEASDKYADEQAKTINKNVPGADVDADDLKEADVKKHGGGFPNPVAWMLKPVTRLQEQSVRLEQEIMKLTGPIGALQPAMLHLDKRMESIEKEMGTTREEISSVRQTMGSISGDIKGMHGDLTELKEPIVQLKQPVIDLKDPVLKLAKPVLGVEARLNNLDNQLNQLKTLLAMILTAIFICAGTIAIGTPLAAIWVWRNRAKIMKMSPAEKAHEDRQLAAVGSQIGNDSTK